MKFSDEQLERYARHIVLREIGGAGQQKLLRARVLVIGAGGLGAPLLLYLAAAGVGHIGVVDADTVSLSNLQRQVLYDSSQLGRPKADAAESRLASLNPDIDLDFRSLRIGPENAAALIGDWDLVADGCDNFATRLAVSDACVQLEKTLVSAALGRFEGQLATFKPHAGTPSQPLPCYRCFVPQAPPRAEIETCEEVGVLGAVAGVIGSMQAVEICKEIVGIGESLAGKLVLYDALRTAFRTVRLRKDPACPACG